jgi:tetratricopeptide (TPR) repeat protein
MRRPVALALAALFATTLAPRALPAAELSRAEALVAIGAGDAAARREAATRLGDVGTMPDTDALFRALRDPDEETRTRAERSLWQVWSRSGRPEVDALYRIGMDEAERGQLDRAIETFTQVIKLEPGFAEAWNKRATLYYLAGDFRRSLADCDEVIKRNPRHFGALSGYAQIYLRLENYERALDYARRAQAVNPNLDGVADLIEALERLVEKRRGQSV